MTKESLLYTNPAYLYAQRVVSGEEITGKYVIMTCQQFLDDIERQDDKDFPYFFDEELAELIMDLCQLINMASGMASGTPVGDALGGFQWFFILNILCWKHASQPERRRYEKAVLLIARKSGKTFLIALVFVLLLLLEPEFAEFYSVAPDKELSSIIKKELEQMIDKSPAISKRFDIVNKEVRCKMNNSKFIPLATSNNRMDGRKANVFVAD